MTSVKLTSITIVPKPGQSLLHITPEEKHKEYNSKVLLMDFTGRPFTVALYEDKLPVKYCTKQWLKKKRKEKAGASKCSKPELLRNINFIFRSALPLCFCQHLQMHYYTTVSYVIHRNSTWSFKKATYFWIFFSTTSFSVSPTSRI